MNNLLTHSPADIVAQAVIASGNGGNPVLVDVDGIPTDPWPTYVAVEPDYPDNVLAFKSTQGRQEGRDMNSGAAFRRYGVQMLVRSRTVEAGYVKAKELEAFFETEVFGMNVTISSSNYRIDLVSDIGDVLPVGYEQGSNRFIHSLNFMVLVEQL